MTMTKNPILDELHAVRDQLLADIGGTLVALVDRLQAEERKSNRPRFTPRRAIQRTGAAKSSDSELENLSPRPGDL